MQGLGSAKAAEEVVLEGESCGRLGVAMELSWLPSNTARAIPQLSVNWFC